MPPARALREPRSVPFLGALGRGDDSYPRTERGLPDAAYATMRVMTEDGQRALDQGVEVLRPLFDRLPPAAAPQPSKQRQPSAFD